MNRLFLGWASVQFLTRPQQGSAAVTLSLSFIVFATIESFWHRLRRRLSRDEWAVRHLGLSTSEGTSEEPGLLLIQIDGLPRRQLEEAIAAGRMPFVRRLRDNGQYPL